MSWNRLQPSYANEMYPEVLSFDDITVTATRPPEKKKFPWWILLFLCPLVWPLKKKRKYFK